MGRTVRSWRVAIVALAVTGVLSVAVPAAYANPIPAPAQTVFVGTNHNSVTPRMSCTLERLTVTTRESNPHAYNVWSRVYYRDVNQQTWYINRGWGFTSAGKYLRYGYISTNGFHNGSEWARVYDRANGRALPAYFGGTEFGFRKPAGYGSEVSVFVLEYHRSRTGGWEHRWIDLGRC